MHSLRLLVAGGNGFIGQHVVQSALAEGVSAVSVLSRSGPKGGAPTPEGVVHVTGDALGPPEALDAALEGHDAVISCIGGFGDADAMRRINGEATVRLAESAARVGVRAFGFVSAADQGPLAGLLLGPYYEGKRAAEAAVLAAFPETGVVARPALVKGNRRVGSVTLPLGALYAPWTLLHRLGPVAALAQQLPVVGPLLAKPVHANSIARALLRAIAEGKGGVREVEDIASS